MYYKDLSKISIEKHKQELKSRSLIPSWQIVLENIDLNFEIIQNSGFLNLAQLKKALKSSKKAKEFAALHNIPEKYILVLRREVQSHHPPDRNLIDYPTLSKDFYEKLSRLDYLTCIQIYPKIKTISDRKTFSQKSKITLNELDYLAHLIDVSRLRYVSPIFATLLVESGYDTIQKISQANPNEMEQFIHQTNQTKNLFKGKLGLSDMKFLILDAQAEFTETEFKD